MTATYEQLDIDTIRQRTQHGLPITQEQQRWLVEQLSGPLEGKKTRCPLCNAEGRIRKMSHTIPCDQCGGDGYILEQPKSDAGKKYGISAERLDDMVIEDIQDCFGHVFKILELVLINARDVRDLGSQVELTGILEDLDFDIIDVLADLLGVPSDTGCSGGYSRDWITDAWCNVVEGAMPLASFIAELEKDGLRVMKPTGIEADICREIAQRQQSGKAKYGQQLSDNPADVAERLQHLKEELLDGAIYCEWAIRGMKDEKGSSTNDNRNG